MPLAPRYPARRRTNSASSGYTHHSATSGASGGVLPSVDAPKAHPSATPTPPPARYSGSQPLGSPLAYSGSQPLGAAPADLPVPAPAPAAGGGAGGATTPAGPASPRGAAARLRDEQKWRTARSGSAARSGTWEAFVSLPRSFPHCLRPIPLRSSISSPFPSRSPPRISS